MVFLGKVVEHINAVIRDSLSAYPTAKLYSVSSQIPKMNKEVLVYLPSVISLDGEGIWMTPDDTHSITIYHKISNSSYSQLKDKGHGDVNDYYSHTYDMEMIVMSDRRVIKIDPSYLEVVIVSNMPLSYRLPKVDYINITPISTNHSAKTVFSQEFSGFDYFLKPEHILLSIKYRIELRYQKGCISLCQCN